MILYKGGGVEEDQVSSINAYRQWHTYIYIECKQAMQTTTLAALDAIAQSRECHERAHPLITKFASRIVPL